MGGFEIKSKKDHQESKLINLTNYDLTEINYLINLNKYNTKPRTQK